MSAEWYDTSDPDNRRAEAVAALENILEGVLSAVRKAAAKGALDQITARGLRIGIEADLAARGYAFRDLGKARYPTADGQSCFEFAEEDGEP